MSHGPELLRILSDGRFHSGETLGRSLGVGRAAVWKSLRLLREGGIDIDSVPGRGYRLAEPLELLSAGEITGALTPEARERLGPIEVHYETDSTNSELLRRARTLASGAVCLAESQRAGRGRRGRHWHSPCARNLYLSLLWRFPRGPDALAGLGLVVGLAASKALEEAGVRGAGVKWPNDIVWRGAKLAGALIELSGESGGATCAVIGIGINVRMPGHLAAGTIEQPWVDVATAIATATATDGRAVSRNRLAAGVLCQLVTGLTRFESAGLPAFMDEWRQRDALQGRAVTVLGTGDGGEEHGTARGIDAGGALIVERGGETRRYLSGDVSVRTRPAGVATAHAEAESMP